jgi:hypothetical protein
MFIGLYAPLANLLSSMTAAHFRGRVSSIYHFSQHLPRVAFSIALLSRLGKLLYPSPWPTNPYKRDVSKHLKNYGRIYAGGLWSDEQLSKKKVNEATLSR